MRIERVGPVAVLHIQAGKANAINDRFLEGGERLLDEAGDAALVLTGYESFFSAGLDLPYVIGLEGAAMAAFMARFSRFMLRLFTWPRPVVAAINGHAIAGGCVLALQADYRIMGDGNARIGLNEVQLGLGLPPVVIETLRCQVPAASLFPIALEGTLFTSEQARHLGLIDQIAPADELLAAAIGKAQTLAAFPKEAYAQIKMSLRQPVVNSVSGNLEADTAAWLATLHSEGARARIQEAVERLTARARS